MPAIQLNLSSLESAIRTLRDLFGAPPTTALAADHASLTLRIK